MVLNTRFLANYSWAIIIVLTNFRELFWTACHVLLRPIYLTARPVERYVLRRYDTLTNVLLKTMIVVIMVIF